MNREQAGCKRLRGVVALRNGVGYPTYGEEGRSTGTDTMEGQQKLTESNNI